MKVENGKTVAVHYRLHLDGFDGELFEETTEDQPLEFAIGAGEMIPAFEAAIMGMEAGQEFQIHIPYTKFPCLHKLCSVGRRGMARVAMARAPVPQAVGMELVSLTQEKCCIFHHVLAPPLSCQTSAFEGPDIRDTVF